MKKIGLLTACCLIVMLSFAQFTYKIKADTLLVTNDSCSAEFALENSTKSIKGFLYNYDKGRTKFVPSLTKINDTTYVIGVDTMKLRATSVDAWRLNGNTGTNPATNFVGTTNAVGLAFRTDNADRMFINYLGDVGIGTTSPASKLHIYGANPNLVIEGDEGSYYTQLTIKSVLGTGWIDNYGIGGMHGTMLQRMTANSKRVGLGANGTGSYATSADSTVITYRVVGAYGQDLDIFRVSRNIAPTEGSSIEEPSFKVTNNGSLWSNSYAQFYNGSSSVPNIKVGYDGTNPYAIHINGSDIGSPLIKIDNITYAGSGGVIDISSNSAYNYSAFNDGAGAGLRMIKTAQNGVGLTNYGGTYTDHQVNNNSNAEVLYGHFTKTRVGASAGYSYYADAQPLSGGTGTAYAFYANAGKSLFKDKLTLDGPNGYSQLRLAQTYTPSATADSNGQAGDVAWDANYIYIKTSSGWKRAALSTF